MRKVHKKKISLRQFRYKIICFSRSIYEYKLNSTQEYKTVDTILRENQRELGLLPVKLYLSSVQGTRKQVHDGFFYFLIRNKFKWKLYQQIAENQSKKWGGGLHDDRPLISQGLKQTRKERRGFMRRITLNSGCNLISRRIEKKIPNIPAKETSYKMAIPSVWKIAIKMETPDEK